MRAAGACYGTDLWLLVGIVLNDVTVDVLVLAADKLVVTRLQFLRVWCVVTHELTLNTIVNVNEFVIYAAFCCISLLHLNGDENCRFCVESLTASSSSSSVGGC